MSDVVLKTIIAEAGGDPDAMAAVAAVIHNRAVAQGKTPEQIVKARGQFEGYSNPGPASVRAQNDAKVLATAKTVWSGIKAGSIADPTNGATMYHADSISPYWAKSANKNGTVNIGGNVFYKGTGSPQTALAAINAVAPPNPQSRPPALAYAQTPASIRAITVNPDGTPDFISGLNAKFPGLNFTPSGKTDAAVTGIKRAPQVPTVARSPAVIAGVGYTAPGTADRSISGPSQLVPPAARMFGTTVLGNRDQISQKDLSPGELAVLNNAVAKAEKEGRNYIGYGDYGEADPWSEGTRNALQALTDLPTSMADTIGMAKFSRQPDGTVVIHDRYDYNASPQKVAEAERTTPFGPIGMVARGLSENGLLGVGNVIGNLVAPEGNGRDVRIQLPRPYPDGSPDLAAVLAAKYGASTPTPRGASGASVTGFNLPPAMPKVPGMIAPGNIDLNNRPVYFGNDGTYGTERSFSIGTDQGEVLIPSIVNGKLVSQADAIKHYQQTGENMGTFASPAAANAYAVKTHNRDQGLGAMPVPMPLRPAALNNPPPLVSRSVNTIPFNPMTDKPFTGQELAQVAANTEAARLRGQVSTSGRVASIPPVAPPRSSQSDLQSALNAYAAREAANRSGITKTVGQAGNVALPAGVVPASVKRDMAAINATQMNRSGSPDDRSNPAPIVPKGLNVVPPTAAQLAALNNVRGAAQQPITHTAIASQDRLPPLPAMAYVPTSPKPAAVAAIDAATVPLPRPRPLPTVPVANVPAPSYLGKQPLTKFLPANQRQNDTLTTAGNVAGNLMSATPIGHLYSLLTGGPNTGGGILNGLFGYGGLLHSNTPAPTFAPPTISASDPLQLAVLAAQRNGETYDRSRDPSFNPNGGAHGGSLAGF